MGRADRMAAYGATETNRKRPQRCWLAHRTAAAFGSRRKNGERGLDDRRD